MGVNEQVSSKEKYHMRLIHLTIDELERINRRLERFQWNQKELQNKFALNLIEQARQYVQLADMNMVTAELKVTRTDKAGKNVQED